MSNPLTKKNPFLSLWLSGANRVAGTGRGLWLAAARRQQTAAVNKTTSLMVSFWSDALKGPSTGKRTKGRR
jgi:hypothetical protein